MRSEPTFLPALALFDPACAPEPYLLEGHLMIPFEGRGDAQIWLYTDHRHLYLYTLCPYPELPYIECLPSGCIQRSEGVRWVEEQREFPIQFADWFLAAIKGDTEVLKKSLPIDGLTGWRAWVQDELVEVRINNGKGYVVSNLSRYDHAWKGGYQTDLLPFSWIDSHGLKEILCDVASRYPANDLCSHANKPDVGILEAKIYEGYRHCSVERGAESALHYLSSFDAEVALKVLAPINDALQDKISSYEPKTSMAYQMWRENFHILRVCEFVVSQIKAGVSQNAASQER